MLTKERRKEIRDKAKAVRTLYELRGAADLNKILKNENIKLLKANNLDNLVPNKVISGILAIVDNEKKIYINNNHANTRNKFTIAHELGHYYLHRDDVIQNGGQLISFRSNGHSTSTQEVEADLFAAELLMPKGELYTQATLNKNGSVGFLANYFNVSEPAMSRRIRELNSEAELEAKELW